MSEAETASRIVALEVRVAHQDRVIEDLNALVTEQWKQIDALAKQVERMEFMPGYYEGKPVPMAYIEPWLE